MRLIQSVALLLLLIAMPASAGVIRGQLWLQATTAKITTMVAASRDASAAPAPDVRRLLRAQSGVSDAVIYVEEIPDRTERRLTKPLGGSRWFSWLPWADKPKPARLKRLVQSGNRFIPRVFVAPLGESIELMNLDRVYHNTFSVSAAKRFDLGKYAPGKTDTLRFDKAGIVNLHCDIHPDEIGYVVVPPNHAYASPDSLGRFTLPELPEGSYRLRYWHPHHGEHLMGVIVPARGDVALELTF
jgi:plastocyanin